MPIEMPDEEKKRRIDTILNFIISCPENEAVPILNKMSNFDPSTLMAFYFSLLNPARNMAIGAYSEKGVNEMFNASNQALKNITEKSDSIKILTKYLLSCPSEDIQFHVKSPFGSRF